MENLINIVYIVAAVLFIFGLKMMSTPKTARFGNFISALGMLMAVVITLQDKGIINYQWIILGMLIGGVIGALIARLVAMTAMPQTVAIFNGFGGLASLLVGWSEYQSLVNTAPGFGILLAIFSAVLIGGVTFTGSVVAFGKLAEVIPGKPFLYRGQQIVNGLLLLGLITAGVFYIGTFFPAYHYLIFIAVVIGAFIFGIFAVIPIGGADMPVVISLLNSYSGLAACAAGFAILNNILIVAGALVGASGIILTRIMCKAMNRSLAHVLFGGFAANPQKKGFEAKGEVKPIVASDAYYILEAARSVVFVPGYGMAVAQAQHAVSELGEILDAHGVEVKFAIHPVAGRMPGHMNVLLAEANVSYDLLVEPDDINPIMETVDVCVVIGANDVVNPAARDEASSPIYGMPIIEVDRARTVFVLKRSMATGFAGVDNPLFFKDNTRMLFGDAKASITALITEFKE